MLPAAIASAVTVKSTASCLTTAAYPRYTPRANALAFVKEPSCASATVALCVNAYVSSSSVRRVARGLVRARQEELMRRGIVVRELLRRVSEGERCSEDSPAAKAPTPRTRVRRSRAVRARGLDRWWESESPPDLASGRGGVRGGVGGVRGGAPHTTALRTFPSPTPRASGPKRLFRLARRQAFRGQVHLLQRRCSIARRQPRGVSDSQRRAAARPARLALTSPRPFTTIFAEENARRSRPSVPVREMSDWRRCARLGPARRR